MAARMSGKTTALEAERMRFSISGELRFFNKNPVTLRLAPRSEYGIRGACATRRFTVEQALTNHKVITLHLAAARSPRIGLLFQMRKIRIAIVGVGNCAS